jgi:hypothetical protein
MTAVAIAALALLAACQGRPKDSAQQEPDRKAAAPSGSAATADAVTVDASLDACRAAVARAASLPRTQRIVALFDGCRPCGDWTPLLGWSVAERAGGPSRAAIEQSLLACQAFCDPNAKQRFYGALDNARAQNTRTPWRLLGEICEAKVSAVPDARYLSAPYFALDRVARLFGGAGSDPGALAALELPLPAVSASGVGVELPSSPRTIPEAGPTALTVDAGQFLLGTLPTAKLSPTGIQVAGDYPGEKLEPRALAAALARPERAGHPAAVLAPRELPASRIIDAVAAAGGHELRLAGGDLELLGWTIPVAIPIALRASAPGRPAGMRIVLDATAFEAMKAVKAAPRAELLRGPVTIVIDDTVTVASLANLLGALGYTDVKSVVLVRAPPPRPAGKP